MPTLRELREKKLFLSRRQLSELSHVSQSTLVRAEEGELIHEEIVEKILKAISEQLGYEVTKQDVEGLNIYNIVRDRKPRPKKKASNKA